MKMKAVFVDHVHIGEAGTIAQAVTVFRQYAMRKFPVQHPELWRPDEHADAAVLLLLRKAGVRHPEDWKVRDHISEGPDGLYVAMRHLDGDMPPG